MFASAESLLFADGCDVKIYVIHYFYSASSMLIRFRIIFEFYERRVASEALDSKRTRTEPDLTWHPWHMQVLTWRGLNSLKDFKTPEGGVGLIPKVLIGAAFLSMATASLMHFLHFRVSMPSWSPRNPTNPTSDGMWHDYAGHRSGKPLPMSLHTVLMCWLIF